MGVAGGLMAGSAITNAFGQMQSAKANSAAASYNAQIASNNADLATQEAKWTTQEGEQNMALSGMKTRATAGAVEAEQGGSGIEVGSGSFHNVKESVREAGLLDVMTIRSNAARQAYGYQVGAVSNKGQEALERANAKYGGTAGAINVGSTVLGGAAKTYEAGGNFGNYLNSRSLFSSDSSSGSPSDNAVLAGVR